MFAIKVNGEWVVTYDQAFGRIVEVFVRQDDAERVLRTAWKGRGAVVPVTVMETQA